MTAWWQLARKNIEPGTSFVYIGEPMAARIDTRHHRLTTIINACQLWAMTAAIQWYLLVNKMAVKHH